MKTRHLIGLIVVGTLVLACMMWHFKPPIESLKEAKSASMTKPLACEAPTEKPRIKIAIADRQYDESATTDIQFLRVESKTPGTEPKRILLLAFRDEIKDELASFLKGTPPQVTIRLNELVVFEGVLDQEFTRRVVRLNVQLTSENRDLVEEVFTAPCLQ